MFPAIKPSVTIAAWWGTLRGIRDEEKQDCPQIRSANDTAAPPKMKSSQAASLKFHAHFPLNGKDNAGIRFPADEYLVVPGRLVLAESVDIGQSGADNHAALKLDEVN